MAENAPLRPGTALPHTLAVEDDAAVREVAESVLQELTARRPDLILFDSGLPEMDGWEVLARIGGAAIRRRRDHDRLLGSDRPRGRRRAQAVRHQQPYRPVDRLIRPHGTGSARG